MKLYDIVQYLRSKDQIGTELAALIASGMPEQVAIGFLVAKAVEPKWAEARQIIDDLGEQVHQGDPLKKSRIDHFNDLLIQKMREQERERRA